MFRKHKKLFPVAVLVLFVAALFSLSGEAQQKSKPGSAPAKKIQGLKPQVFQAVKFGQSIALRDMPAAGEIDIETLSTLDRRAINEKNVALKKVPRAGAPLPSIDAAIAG